MRKINIAIVMPVYNDWTSFRLLILDLAKALSSSNCSVEIVAVDDCSSESVPERIVANCPIEKITILELEGNVGHQRAIAVGLTTISDRPDVDYVAVMDSDGEDTAPELARLIEAAKANPNCVVVAQRAQRSEGQIFRLFYALYIGAFWLLTGRRINFGNFSLLPFEHLARLVHTPDIWNNFPATLIRAGLPLKYVPTARGTRYAGQSKMNLVNLVVHGLGAISVFSEVAFVRILLASTLLFVASMMGLIVVTGVWLFTNLAIPGWATNVFGFLILMSVQAGMLPVMVAFLLLNNRASVRALPKSVAMGFIRKKSIPAIEFPRGGVA